MDEIFKSISFLHLTMGLQCNARCCMCYQSRFDAGLNMPAVVYRDHLEPLYPYLSEVAIQGGEPTIMPQCRDLVSFLRQFPGIKLTIVTNGILVDEFWMDAFRRQGKMVNFSLNAATAGTYDKIVANGDFDAVLGNIRVLTKDRKQREPVVSLSMVVLRHNLGQISDFIKLADDLGADSVYFTVDPLLSFKGAGPRPRLQAELEKALRISKGARVSVSGLDVLSRWLGLAPARQECCLKQCCDAPFKSLWVGNDGDVSVCCTTWRRIGNTYKKSLKEILEGKERIDFQRKVQSRDYSWCPPECPDNLAPSHRYFLNRCCYVLCTHPEKFLASAGNKLGKILWM